MKRLFALLLLFVAIPVVGTGLVIASAAPVPGMATIAIGLAVGGVAWWLDRQRVLAEAESLHAEIQAAGKSNRFEANIHYGRVLFLLSLVFAMGVLGVWVGVDSSKPTVVAFGLVIAGLVAYPGWQFLRWALQPGPAMSMDMRGLRHVMFGTIPWQDIVGIAMRTVSINGRTQHALVLGLHQPHRFVHGLPVFARWKYRKWQQDPPKHGDIDLPIDNLDRKPQVVLAAAQAMLHRQHPSAPALWQPQMDASDLETLMRADALHRDLQALPLSQGPEHDAALAAISAQMEALTPEIERFARNRYDRARKQRNQARLMAVLGVLFFIIWIALKFIH